MVIGYKNQSVIRKHYPFCISTAGFIINICFIPYSSILFGKTKFKHTQFDGLQYAIDKKICNMGIFSYYIYATWYFVSYLGFNRIYYTMSKNTCLQGYFYEAVNDTGVPRHTNGEAVKTCDSKDYCVHYTISIYKCLHSL